MERNNNLDFLRLLAAVAVIFSHSFALSQNNYALDPLVKLTNNQMSSVDLAVAVFFIISGYLITQSYDKRQDAIYFLKARVLRIFPALAFVVVISVFVMGPLLSTLPANEYFKNEQTYRYLGNILLYPFQYYLPGVFENNILKGVVNGSLWTLAYEFTCYIFVFILGTLKLLNKQSVVILFLATFCLSNMFALPLNEFSYRLIYLGCYFCAGMMLYMFREYIKLNYKIALISVAMLVACAVFGGLVKAGIPLFGSYIIYFVAFNPSIKLHNISKYGDFSYGMYIYAFPIQQGIVYLFGGQMSSVTNLILSLIATLLISFVSWHLIEKRALNLRYYGMPKLTRSSTYP